MSNLSKLPVKAECAIMQALRAVRHAGGDELTIRALAQQLGTDLEHHGFELRPGFRLGAVGVLDLSGKNRVEELANRTAAIGEERERSLEA